MHPGVSTPPPGVYSPSTPWYISKYAMVCCIVLASTLWYISKYILAYEQLGLCTRWHIRKLAGQWTRNHCGSNMNLTLSTKRFANMNQGGHCYLQSTPLLNILRWQTKSESALSSMASWRSTDLIVGQHIEHKISTLYTNFYLEFMYIAWEGWHGHVDTQNLQSPVVDNKMHRSLYPESCAHWQLLRHSLYSLANNTLCTHCWQM